MLEVEGRVCWKLIRKTEHTLMMLIGSSLCCAQYIMYYPNQPLLIIISGSLSTVAPTVTIEFEPRNVSVIESDGSVTVNLVKTGYHSDNITVYISITRIDNPGIVKCMYICMLYTVLYSV